MIAMNPDKDKMRMRELQGQAASVYAHWANVAVWSEKVGNITQAAHAKRLAAAAWDFAEGAA